MALTGWNYRKKITLTGQSNAGTGYQVKLLVGESSGATGEDFDVDSKSASFPSAKNISGDLRFTSSDGTTLLDFWVESVSGSTPNRLATIWVKVGEDLGTNKDIYCYYDGTTTSVSNGDDTFEFFDDFEGTSIDTNKWTLRSGTINVSGSEAYANTGNPYEEMDTSGKVSISSDANRGLAMRFNIRRTGNCDTYVSFTEDASNRIRCGNTSYNGEGVYYYGNGRYYLSQIGVGGNGNGDYLYECKCVGTSLLVTQSSGISNQRTLPNTFNSRTFYLATGGGDRFYPMNYINFIAVRRFIATEPSFSSASGEEPVITTSIKSINGLAYASVKSWNGLAKESIKSINGLE